MVENMIVGSSVEEPRRPYIPWPQSDTFNIPRVLLPLPLTMSVSPTSPTGVWDEQVAGCDGECPYRAADSDIISFIQILYIYIFQSTVEDSPKCPLWKLHTVDPARLAVRGTTLSILIGGRLRDRMPSLEYCSGYYGEVPRLQLTGL